MIALAAFCLGGISAYAQNQVGTAPVKMTYVDFNTPDDAMGQKDTIKVGYNKAPAVDGTIAFGNTGWGCNWIGVLKVDVSAIPGTVQKATLKAKISGSTDSKRTTGWGVALTDNAWAADLTYTTVSTWTVSKLLNSGNLAWGTQKAITVFEDASWDITDALSSGQATATLLVYETAAAGGYMTEAYAEIEYEPFEATTTTYGFEDENKVFTDDSRITSAIEADATLNSNVLGWTCANNAQNGYSFSHYDFTNLLNQPALVAVEFDYYNTKGGRAILNIGDALVRGTTGGSSKVTYNKTGVIFQIGSDKGNAFIQGVNVGQDDVTEEQDVLDGEGNPTGEKTTVVTSVGICNKWLHVTLMVNNDAKTVAWIVADQEGKELYSGSGAFFAEDANACTQIDLFGYINNSHCAMLDNLSITNYKSNAVFADYTIKYVDANGNEIKEARTANGQVGKFVTLLDSDKAAIQTDNMKYIYESDNSAEVAIADGGTAVITVTFREAAKYYAVLNCKAGSETVKQFRDNDKYWFWEGDNFYLYPSRAYKASDGKYYFTEATSWNGTTFTFPGALTSASQGGKTYYIGTLNYTAVDSVAYYANFEDLALPVTDEGNGTGLGQLVGTVNSWYSFSGGIFDRFDGGRGIRLDAGSYVYTEPIAEEGAYKVTIYGRNDVSAADANPYALGFIEKGSEEVKIYSGLTINSWGSATTGESVVEGVNIPAGAKLVIMNTNEADANSKVSLDDISLTKTGEYQIPTGIKNVEKIQNAGVIYNLAGQKVSNNFKGIVVKDGRKMIQK
jgi:hypothetical protein